MKSAFDIKEICEEYCDEAVIHSEDEVAVLVNSKYFKDLKIRLNAHNWLLKKMKKKHFLIYCTFFNPLI
jgi:hypothetical protein